MATHDAQGRELFVCSECKCRRIATEFDVDRHGHRRKGCLRCKARREARKCPHGLRPTYCHERGDTRATNQKRLRNARAFASQYGGWPYLHIRVGRKEYYDDVVGKWLGVFKKLLEDGLIDDEYHRRILANLRPWGAEPEPPAQVTKDPLKLSDTELTDLLADFGF